MGPLPEVQPEDPDPGRFLIIPRRIPDHSPSGFQPEASAKCPSRATNGEGRFVMPKKAEGGCSGFGWETTVNRLERFPGSSDR